MSKFMELNLEEGYPTVNEAMEMLKYYLSFYKKQKIECILIIHGYGSSGQGGKIKNKVRQFLENLHKEGDLKRVVFGERFDLFNADARELKNKYPELSELMKQYNPGVTVCQI